jgi:hypothetical protein
LCLGPGHSSLLHLTRANAEKPYAGDTVFIKNPFPVSHVEKKLEVSVHIFETPLSLDNHAMALQLVHRKFRQFFTMALRTNSLIEPYLTDLHAESMY